jgi:nicotinamide/nicotinate riboside kinase
MDAWLVIGISGVTCSGKSTLARGLLENFQAAQGQSIRQHLKLARCVLIQQDSYFRPKDSALHKQIEGMGGCNNRDIIEAIDMDRMCKDILEVLGENFLLFNTGDECVKMDEERNMFADHHINFKNAAKYQKLNQHPYISLNILILEGFLLFNHPFTLDLCGLKYHMHVPYELCQKRRKERRRERLNAPDHVGYFEMVVWPMYEKHFKEFRDVEGLVILNGALPREQIGVFVRKSIENAL